VCITGINGIYYSLITSIQSGEGKILKSLKSLLLLSTNQRNVCKRLEQNRGRLYRMAYAWSHHSDVADEVVQETMIKALASADKVKDLKSMDGWLFRILSNCFIDIYRKHKDHIDVDDVVLIEAETPETIHSKNEMLDAVRAAIALLPFKHRQVLTLVDIESLSYAEVAEIVDVPPGTIMSRLNRARQSLKQLLDDQQKNNKDIKLKIVPIGNSTVKAVP
jgi:RNA polymerase sigma-70 factor, ECF subfamily